MPFSKRKKGIILFTKVSYFAKIMHIQKENKIMHVVFMQQILSVFQDTYFNLFPLPIF